MSMKKPQVVFTNKARCRDCYRCVRVCPVKAIRVQDGQASIVEERCIGCGTCIRECPQHAKSYRHDTERVLELFSSGKRVAASIAPSFATLFHDWELSRLPSALRKLGFSYVAETAVGAYSVAQETIRAMNSVPDRPQICTACPAVVNFIEMYKPQLVEFLSPVVSPMIAHARMLKSALGENAAVVFIGPCVAKKAEAERPELDGLVDAVLTFAELRELLVQAQVDLASCEESAFDDQPGGDARFFPLVGGLARTGAINPDHLSMRLLAVSGIDEIREALDCIQRDPRPALIEPLFCSQGCVNGPAIPGERNIFDRRHDLLQYAAERPGDAKGATALPLETHFYRRLLIDREQLTEQQIQRELERTGKGALENQLNCGSCGYSSCREKAIAAILGLAEPEMCIPYMRRLAEQRTDRIIETSPNGIVTLDDRLHIIHMNPAFRRFFMCTETVAGKHIAYLMDPHPFERLVAGEERVEMTVHHEKYGIVCHQILYPLKEERQYVGIFVNITNSQSSQHKLDELRAQTTRQAQELLQHQIQMAQQIGKFLGESAARGEKLVDDLMRMAEDAPVRARDPGKMQ